MCVVGPLDFRARSGSMSGVPRSIMFALVTDFFPVSLHLLRSLCVWREGVEAD